MDREVKFKIVKNMIINEMTSNAPIIFLNYDYENRRLDCQWKKINRTFRIEKGEAYYNISNPDEIIFMMDFQDNISKCYHLLELLYYNYLNGIEICQEDYLFD